MSESEGVRLQLRIRHYRHTLAGFRLYQRILECGTIPNRITLGIDGKGLAIHPRIPAQAAFRMAMELTDDAAEFYQSFYWGMNVSPMGGLTEVTVRILRSTGIVEEHSTFALCRITEQYNKKSGVIVALTHLLEEKPVLVELIAGLDDDPVAQRIQNCVPWLFREEDAEPIQTHLERWKTAHRGPQRPTKAIERNTQ